MRVTLVHPAGFNFVPGQPDFSVLANRMVPIGILTLAAWLVEVNVVLITLHAFGLHPSAGVSLLVLVAVTLALVVPFAPPGNLGTLEVGAMLALMEFGVSKEPALAFALIYHLLQVVPICLLGLVFGGHALLRPVPAPESSQP